MAQEDTFPSPPRTLDEAGRIVGAAAPDAGSGLDRLARRIVERRLTGIRGGRIELIEGSRRRQVGTASDYGESALDAQLKVLDWVGPAVTAEEVAAIQQVMVDTGAVDACEHEIDQLLDESTTALDAIPDVNGSRAAIEALADFVVSREA